MGGLRCAYDPFVTFDNNVNEIMRRGIPKGCYILVDSTSAKYSLLHSFCLCFVALYSYQPPGQNYQPLMDLYLSTAANGSLSLIPQLHCTAASDSTPARLV